MPENLPDYGGHAPHHKQIPIELIIDYKRRGLTQAQVAKLLDCSEYNISKRLAPHRELIDCTQKYVDNRPFILALEQERIRQHITPAKLAKASARDLAVMFGIFYDKERLETGQSTQNIAYADLVKARESLAKERAELEADPTSSIG
jgi:transcriptional regulator with XRE-family HTH domain